MSPVVELKNVHKKFGDQQVLKGISLSVNKGEILAVIGQSGSGKSTALRCMNYLETIDEGEIIVCGHKLSADRKNVRNLRRDVGIVFQSYNLFPHLTVLQNISLALVHVKKLPRPQARELAEQVLAQVGLAEKCGAYPEQLSGGQQQRVAIARSLAMDPQLMLFDEVTSALDPQLTGEVLKVIEALAVKGMTMVLVTHEMAFAYRLANRIVFMHQGQVWEEGSSEILKNPATKELQEFVGNGL